MLQEDREVSKETGYSAMLSRVQISEYSRHGVLEISGKRGTATKSILSDGSTRGPKVVSPYPYSANPSPGYKYLKMHGKREEYALTTLCENN